MDEPQDSEVTLGTGKLLAIFFGLVIVCGIFFALGYSFGRANAPIPMQETSTTSAAVTGGPKPAPHGQPTSPPAEVTPVTTSKNELSTPATSDPTPPPKTTNDSKPPELTNPGKGYIVQVAAVTKQEDADALVSALRTKKYPVFLVSSTASDKYFHVQVGPFASQQEAEAMRAQLVKDGYDAMLKK